ncbi:MAG: sulfite exporter TauE/SafE family protein [Verrucomicrobia bacterium]|nr:sulfite exporter TauE/SafE family protein [Verrucomicrobiota bacterium]
MIEISEITVSHWALALLGAFSLGFSKTGFPGMALVNVLIMAELFGAKQSVGLILPLLIVCDVTVFPMFRRHATWSQVWPILIPSCIGIVGGYFLLGGIDNSTARKSIGLIILVMLVLQLVRGYKQDFLKKLPDSESFRWGSGLTIGISTMMANAAGPVYSIYALVHKMPKMEFLGIGARCFLLVNIIKVPFMTDLDIINAWSLKMDALLLPGIFAGILVGRRVIDRIPQKAFEVLLYAFSGIAGVRLFMF